MTGSNVFGAIKPVQLSPTRLPSVVTVGLNTPHFGEDYVQQDNYFSQYKSPNIVIIPAPLCYPPSPKRPKVDNEMQSLSPQHDDLSFLDDFNIDEIVECLNSCDDNDNTIQDTVNDTPDELVEHNGNKDTASCCESQLNENDGQKSDTTEFDLTKKLNIVLINGENALKNKVVTNILDSNDNDCNRISDTNTLRSDDYNTQLDSTPVENTDLESTCSEAEITEKDTEQISIDQEQVSIDQKQFSIDQKQVSIDQKQVSIDQEQVLIDQEQVSIDQEQVLIDQEQVSIDQTKHFDKINKNEHIEVNNNGCPNTKVLLNKNPNNPTITITDKKNESQENNINLTPKNTTNIVKTVLDTIKPRVLNKGRDLPEESPVKASATTLKSVVSNTYLYQKLENRMFDYLHKKYSIESVVHYGKFSKIFKCKDPSGKQYAVKMLNKQSDRFCLGINKDNMLMRIQAEIPKENLFLVYCLGSFSLNRYWCFVMDYYPKNLKQTLEESPKPFHIDQVQELARQLVAAVTLLRNNNIVHSDIKPNHILINSSKNSLKLCGFDKTYYIDEAFIKPNIGSVNYRPPEVILGYSAGFSLDVWCTALVLYEMTTGTQLFPGDSNMDILNKQICAIGSIPADMLRDSYYTSRYFLGGIFRKRLYFNEKAIYKNDYKKLYKTVYAAYYNNWASSRTKIQKTKDLNKIKSLLKLLEQMLTIHPKYRITIEFVYANPFIYEVYDF